MKNFFLLADVMCHFVVTYVYEKRVVGCYTKF